MTNAAALAMLGVVMAAVTGTPSARPGAQTSGSSPVAGSAAIVGQVIDEAGRPVPHAMILVAGESASTLSAAGDLFHRLFVADEHGHFALANLAAGQYLIRATRPGYAEGFYGRRRPEGSFGAVNLRDGERRLDVAITLWKLAAITGVITDDTGGPRGAVAAGAVEPGWPQSAQPVATANARQTSCSLAGLR